MQLNRADSGSFTVRNLRDGKHTFRVRASDGLHVEPTPAIWRFTVDRTGPRITIARGPYRLGRRDHKVRIKVACRRTEVARCRSILALKLGRKSFGTEAFSVRPGRTVRVAVLVPRGARTALFRAGTLRVRATVTSRDDLRNRSHTTRLVTLKKP